MKLEKAIQYYRQELDKTTKDLVKLIAKRNKIVFKIGKIKRKLGLPITDFKRDKEVLKKAKLISKEKMVNPKTIEAIIKILIKYAKEIQKK